MPMAYKLPIAKIIGSGLLLYPINRKHRGHVATKGKGEGWDGGIILESMGSDSIDNQK